MKASALLIETFNTDTLNGVIDKAEDKGIEREIIKNLCKPSERENLYKLIISGNYDIKPPRVAKIPKDKPGEFREVYINFDRDRVLLSGINDALFKVFPEMIHPQCKSYQKGIGTQEVVQTISKEIVRLGMKQEQIGVKLDLSKYFDTVLIEKIDEIFDLIENKLGFEYGTEPIVNVLRKYYHQDLYFDNHDNVCRKYQSLKQGCAVASWLANVLLYELDEYMSNKYKIYYRYSDDMIVIDNDTSEVIDEVNSIINKYGVHLNPKKVEKLYKDKWFKFLGFNMKGSLITLSSRRVKTFQHEIEKRTIKQKKCSLAKARKNVIEYLYDGELCWAMSCLGTINVDKDLIEMDNFIKDCLRACETKKKNVGGLGSSLDRDEYTVCRGKGKNVRTNLNKIGSKIDNYYSLNCMSKALKMNKAIFKSLVSDMK